MRLKALIFDVDGTLADNEEAHRLAFNAAFDELAMGWNWSQARYAQLLRTAGGKERLGIYIDSLALSRTETAALKERIAPIHQVKTAHYTRIIASGSVPLREGVRRLIDEAADAHIQVAIASTTTLANIEALISAHFGADALRRFASIGCDHQVATKKPAPDVYRWVLRELGKDAADCVAIEDSNNGARAAKAAGLFTIVTPSFWTRDEDFSTADLILPSLSLGVREIDGYLEGKIDGHPRQNHH